jgi:hypothetical protein
MRFCPGKYVGQDHIAQIPQIVRRRGGGYLLRKTCRGVTQLNCATDWANVCNN